MTDPVEVQTAAATLSRFGHLPPLNPLHITKARSTLASAMVILGAAAPFLPEGWRDVGANPEGVMGWFDQLVAAITGTMEALDKVIMLAGTAWLYLERRNPKRRLTFRSA